MGRHPKVTREQVLRVARAAFAERGFEATTLAAIAARLGVSAAALLRHAPSKEALFAAAMRAGEGEIRPPVEFLADLAGDEDPLAVLERLARAMVPFLEQKLDETVASWMRSKVEVKGIADIPLPFDPSDPSQGPTPPQRVVVLLEEYLRRAVAAGRLSLSDPRAAALAYLGSLHSYVMLHRMIRIFDPPLPLDRYLQTLRELWTRGAVAGAVAPARRPAVQPQAVKRPRARRPARGGAKETTR